VIGTRDPLAFHREADLTARDVAARRKEQAKREQALRLQRNFVQNFLRAIAGAICLGGLGAMLFAVHDAGAVAIFGAALMVFVELRRLFARFVSALFTMR